MNLKDRGNKICHMTSVHGRYDVRIFYKECISLAKTGYDVYLVVADGKGDEEKEGIKIRDVGKLNGRIKRMINSTKKIYKKALSLDCDIYHFHDPELLPSGVKLKKQGYTVIYDAHEDVTLDISQKRWLPKFLRYILSKCYAFYERKVVKKLDAVITVTPHIVDMLSKYSSQVHQITNYPIIEEQKDVDIIETKKREICFAGGITENWHHEIVLDVISEIDNIVYRLAGSSSEAYLRKLRQMDGWSKVCYYGVIPHAEVQAKVYSEASVGMALYFSSPYPVGSKGTLGNTKLFEYMLNKIPVVCTDFVLWREIVENNDCGICVNTENSKEVKEAVEYLLNNPDAAIKMGENGYKAVLKNYNWSTQEAILLNLYSNLLRKNVV